MGFNSGFKGLTCGRKGKAHHFIEEILETATRQKVKWKN